MKKWQEYSQKFKNKRFCARNPEMKALHHGILRCTRYSPHQRLPHMSSAKPSGIKSIFTLAAFILIPLAIGLVGSMLTADNNRIRVHDVPLCEK
jgi:hypothetical protein